MRTKSDLLAVSIVSTNVYSSFLFLGQVCREPRSLPNDGCGARVLGADMPRGIHLNSSLLGREPWYQRAEWQAVQASAKWSS